MKTIVKMSYDDCEMPSDFNHDSLVFTDPEPVSAARSAAIELNCRQHEEYLQGKAPYPSRRKENMMKKYTATKSVDDFNLYGHHEQHHQPNKGLLNLGALRAVFGGRKNEEVKQTVSS